MPLKKEALRGYILEEVLAYLIRSTGYHIIVSASEDTEDLEDTSIGLSVIGRGARHQVDILGQLEWIPAFTFPLRLFVEAKFREGRTGLSTVRNAVGVLFDLNQKNLPNVKSKDSQRLTPFRQEFHYAYALFSTSGFTRDAQDMAVAHQISLIDLGGAEYRNLRDAIVITSDSVSGVGRAQTIFNLRYAIRSALGTSAEMMREHQSFDSNLVDELRRDLTPVITTTREYGEIFVGMANGPFMLLLKARDPQAFLNYARDLPRHRVRINWSSRYENGRIWIITPVEGQARSPSYTLEFRLPEILDLWIYESNTDPRGRALAAKGELLSNITIYHREPSGDRIFTLEYDARATRSPQDLTERNPLE